MNRAATEETFNILYGKSGMQIRLPQGTRATVIGKRPMAKLPDPQEAVPFCARYHILKILSSASNNTLP